MIYYCLNMEIRKNIQTQDSGFKISPVRSGESAINISNEILQLIYPQNETREFNTEITFTIYKEDFVKAFCFIVSKLPLYKTTSQTAIKKEFSMDFYSKYSEEIENFFGDSVSKDYTCNLLLRKDGRNYLNKLKYRDFSIRDFFIEDSTEVVFGKENNGELYLRINCLKEIHEDSQLILSENQHCYFALKCLTYFREQSLWNNINKYVDPFIENDSIKVSGDTFSLTGLFKFVTEEKLSQLNSPRRRWYFEPFQVKGKTVYLSTEWYPELTETKSRLSIPMLGNLITECFGSIYFVIRNGENWELRKKIIGNSTNPVPSAIPPTDLSIESDPFSISELINCISETGLLYDGDLIKRFAFSLMSKKFLILSGLAGSGKTQLALAFADALIESNKQKCVVSVGADWTNREPLLGFPNALQEGSYVTPESHVLDLLIESNKPENAHKPFFLILDEMNMSYVERYFADFLSAMESKEPISLWNGSQKSDVPKIISLPNNLFIIGTINVDETTYMFSPKVLDRANVIEFKISEKEMDKFLDEMKPVNRESLKYKASAMGQSFVELASEEDLANDEIVKQTLKSFFVHLKSVNAEFGYRSATEIYRFISQALKNDDSVKPENIAIEPILDWAMVQKLLPKLHGSRKKLEPVLQALWKECFNDSQYKESISAEFVSHAKYPLTADKLQRMYAAAYANGFTSFAEA